VGAGEGLAAGLQPIADNNKNMLKSSFNFDILSPDPDKPELKRVCIYKILAEIAVRS
jgi:hypothetical protein